MRKPAARRTSRSSGSHRVKVPAVRTGSRGWSTKITSSSTRRARRHLPSRCACASRRVRRQAAHRCRRPSADGCTDERARPWSHRSRGRFGVVRWRRLRRLPTPRIKSRGAEEVGSVRWVLASARQAVERPPPVPAARSGSRGWSANGRRRPHIGVRIATFRCNAPARSGAFRDERRVVGADGVGSVHHSRVGWQLIDERASWSRPPPRAFARLALKLTTRSSRARVPGRVGRRGRSVAERRRGYGGCRANASAVRYGFAKLERD
jgi:hypothetical protein